MAVAITWWLEPSPDSGIDADRPLLVYAAGKPWVAFREGDDTEQVLRVVTLP